MCDPKALYLRLFFSKKREMSNTNGKMQAASIPFFKSLSACCVIFPTSPGPNAPPRSPAIASKANMAVPPFGSLSEHILIVPGHIMPTEKPHIIQPISPITELSDMDADM